MKSDYEEELVALFRNQLPLIIPKDSTVDQLIEIRKRITKNIKDLHKAKEQIDLFMQQARNKNSAVFITDHAIVRYLERVKGISIEQLEDQIMPEKLLKEIYAKGDGRYEHNGYILQVVDGTVLTIFKKDKS